MINYLWKSLEGWNFDPVTSALTVVIATAGAFVFRMIRKPLFDGVKYVVSGVMYTVVLTLTKAAADCAATARDSMLSSMVMTSRALTGEVHPGAAENGQISCSSVVRGGRGDGDHLRRQPLLQGRNKNARIPTLRIYLPV
jgi:hypothetical protein